MRNVVQNLSNLKNFNNKKWEISTCEYIPYIDILDEWIIATSYLTKEESEFLNNHKTIDSISLMDDLDKFKQIKEIEDMHSVFEKYKRRECSDSEYERAKKYMKNSITKFMESRLSNDDIKLSNSIVESIKKEDISDIRKFIEERLYEYNNYSLFNIYTLRKVIDYYIHTEDEKCNNNIKNENIDRNNKLVKQLTIDYGIKM